jgi:hypothetical protein
MRRWLTIAALLVVTGCSAPVAGDPVRDGTTTAESGTSTESMESSETTEDTETAADPSTGESEVAAPPTAIDQDARVQYCDGTITGALGKDMQVAVVETSAGRVNCDQAGAVLVDYYVERPEPDPGSGPVEVAGFACGQVPEPDLPQVICADGASLFFSMWVQGG